MDTKKRDDVNKVYSISMEVAGSFAHWSRPDSGSSKNTYEIPTYSEVKGMFESVLRLQNAIVVPIRVEICMPIKTSEMTFNYHGFSRKGDLFAKKAAAQISMVLLEDVCYKLYADVVDNKENFTEKSSKYKNINNAHSYQSQFFRRLEKNQSYSQIVLGTSEFLPTYWGRIRLNTERVRGLNFSIPFMLKTPFDKPTCGSYSPQFYEKVDIIDGVAIYPKESYALSLPNKEEK